MASLAQLGEALKRADAQGNVEDARKLASAYASLKAQLAQPTADPRAALAERLDPPNGAKPGSREYADWALARKLAGDDEARSLLDAGMASDISKLEGGNRFTRPILAGNAYSTVEVSTPVVCVTVRQSEFPPAEPTGATGRWRAVSAFAPPPSSTSSVTGAAGGQSIGNWLVASAKRMRAIESIGRNASSSFSSGRDAAMMASAASIAGSARSISGHASRLEAAARSDQSAARSPSSRVPSSMESSSESTSEQRPR